VALLALAIQAPGNAQADPDIRGLINSVDSGSISFQSTCSTWP